MERPSLLLLFLRLFAKSRESHGFRFLLEGRWENMRSVIGRDRNNSQRLFRTSSEAKSMTCRGVNNDDTVGSYLGIENCHTKACLAEMTEI